jgi:transcriptional regulator with XRE-family HTH domain
MIDEMRFYIPGREFLPEPYHLRGIGLPNVYLLNGVTLEASPYGDLVTVEHLAGLHRTVGLHLIRKPRPLAGVEFRFLRKLMGLTQRELAGKMSVSDQTIANYEKDKTAPSDASAHLRLLAALALLPVEAADELRKAIGNLTHNAGLDLSEKPADLVGEGWREDLRTAA